MPCYTPWCTIPRSSGVYTSRLRGSASTMLASTVHSTPVPPSLLRNFSLSLRPVSSSSSDSLRSTIPLPRELFHRPRPRVSLLFRRRRLLYLDLPFNSFGTFGPFCELLSTVVFVRVTRKVIPHFSFSCCTVSSADHGCYLCSHRVAPRQHRD